MNKKFCSSCGEMLTGEGKFCSGCGQPLTSTIGSETPNSALNESTINQPAYPTPKKASINKWIYIAIAVVIAFFAYTSFTKSTPEKVAKEFVESLFSFDFEKVNELLAYSADEDLVEEFKWMLERKRENPKDVKDELNELKKEGYVLKEFIIREKNIMKDYATLSVDMILKNGDEDTGYIELVKESGKWKISYLD